MGKKKDKITVEVVGGNCESVTGSCSIIKYQDKTILFELGMIQEGNTSLENIKMNRKLLSHIKIKEISMVVIGHNHCDHIGLIPALFATGDKDIRIIVPNGSSTILQTMWADSVNIMERDCESYSNRKNSIEVSPLYSQNEVELAISHIEEFDSNILYELDEYLTLRYIPAGHIVCSQQTELFININNHTKKILFTSDLGNTLTQNSRVFVKNFEPIAKANIVIGECTYSKRSKTASKKDFQQDMNKIISIIEEFCIEKQGRVLIPCFSLDRIPYVLWLLYSVYGQNESFNIPIYVDSPLANTLIDNYLSILKDNELELFKSVLSWKNIKRIRTSEESKMAIIDYKPVIVLSSSGMLTAGRSIKWTQSILPNRNDCILFMGYAGENTLAHKIKNLDTKSTIMINGVQLKNRCTIVDLCSFSSHMQRNELINYYKGITCEKIYLVHSNNNDKLEFKEDLEKSIADCCKTTRVIAVNRSTVISL